MIFIDRFIGEYSFLSNFHPSVIRIPNNAWLYPTVEHFFQAHKVPMGTQAHQDIMDAESPAMAKQLGRKLRDPKKNWDNIKVGVMLVALRYKFKMHERLGRQLIETGDAYLIEGNTWGDTYWGQDEYGKGFNVLGTLLMMVRNEISPSSGFQSFRPKEP